MATKHASSGELIDLRSRSRVVNRSMVPIGARLNVAVARELVAWLKVISRPMSCLMGATPNLPRDVLLELLAREWAMYANDGRLVRTDNGYSVSECE